MITANNGKFFWPNGKRLIAAGLNIYGGKPADQVLSLFPRANWLRCGVSGLSDDFAANWDQLVGKATQAGKVCEFEYHPWPLEGEGEVNRQLYTQYLRAIVQRYGSNPLVVISSMNEPQSGDLTGEHVFLYQTLRAAGYQGLILLMGGLGGGNPGQTGRAVMDPSAYTGMKNIGFTIHSYGWPNNYTTDINSVRDTLFGNDTDTGLRSLLAFASADGPMGVIIDEFGPCTDASRGRDPNADQVLQTVTVDAIEQGLAQGYVAWDWDADPVNALQDNGQLTAWGRDLNNRIAHTLDWAASQGADVNGLGQQGGTPVPTKPPSPPSPDMTTVSDTSGAIVDAHGNRWTITGGGQVAVNGAADTTTMNAIELAYVKQAIWHQNRDRLWWFKGAPSDQWAPPAGTATSPLPAPAGPTKAQALAALDTLKAFVSAA